MNEAIAIVEELPARIRVILTNLLTWLIGLQTLLTFVVAQGDLINVPEVAEYGGLALTAIASAIVFIRKVTPVEPAERGILPVESELG